MQLEGRCKLLKIMDLVIFWDSERTNGVNVYCRRCGTGRSGATIRAIQQKLAAEKKKVRRAPPAVGSADGPRVGILTPEQIDEAMFG